MLGEMNTKVQAIAAEYLRGLWRPTRRPLLTGSEEGQKWLTILFTTSYVLLKDARFVKPFRIPAR